LILATFLSIISTWINPSILSRVIQERIKTDVYSMQHNLCIVPPYLWFNSSMPQGNSPSSNSKGIPAITNRRPLMPILATLPDESKPSKSSPSNEYRFSGEEEKERTLHGWASSLDLLIVAGMASTVLFAMFWIAEHARVKEEWVRLALIRMQSTFNYGR
jgi:hypothetical protein